MLSTLQRSLKQEFENSKTLHLVSHISELMERFSEKFGKSGKRILQGNVASAVAINRIFPDRTVPEEYSTS